jgi:hypothetical protein
MSPKVAVVFGASGVSGWSFVNEMLNDYPQKGIWGNVYAFTNRPLAAQDSLWPMDDRLHIVSGVDLLKGTQEDLDETIRSKVPDVASVTHVYYLGEFVFWFFFSFLLFLLFLALPFAGRERES